MPTVQNTNVSDCICTFAEALGPAKQTLSAFINSLIAVLQAAKIAEQLTSYNLEDLTRRVLLEAALAYYQALVAEIAAGVNVVVGMGNRFSDCPPVGSLMRKVKAARDDFLGPLYEQEYEIQQYIAALEDKTNKVNNIQKMIDWLNTWLDALDACGT